HASAATTVTMNNLVRICFDLRDEWERSMRSTSPRAVRRRYGGRKTDVRRYVFVYSGPEPPSGGVRRPPFAVMAPHCTQFDGATFTVTVPSPFSAPSSYTCAGQRLTQSSATSRGTVRSMRMWFGWSSRVLFPERKTDESLSKVSLPSAAGYD